MHAAVRVRAPRPPRSRVVACACLAAALIAGCSSDPTGPRESPPVVRHVMFTSGDQAVSGDTMYVTSQLVNDGPGAVFWLHGSCEPPFVIAMGDSVRVYLSNPLATGACTAADTEAVAAGATMTDGLAFTGPLWDSLGAPFDAPTGRYVVRRAVTYSRRADLASPIDLARSVEFRWVRL